MLKIFKEICSSLKKVGMDEVETLLPGTGHEKRIEYLLGDLRELDSVTKYWKIDNVSIVEARALFNVTIEKFPMTENRLSSSAKNLHEINFEAWIVKVQERRYRKMSTNERNKVGRVVRNGVRSTTENTTGLSFAEKHLKMRRLTDRDDE